MNIIKPASLAVAMLSAVVVRGQQLAYPAKYYIDNIILHKRLPGSLVNEVVDGWDVRMVLVTGQDGLRIYNAVGAGHLRETFGAPVYQLGNLVYANRSDVGAEIIEVYVADYRGYIEPPDDEVGNTANVIVAWTSSARGGNTLKVVWPLNEKAGQKIPIIQRGDYHLTFYCRPAGN